MTLDQKKISLIRWISNLNDESTINALADLREKSLQNLPDEIVQFLESSNSESEDTYIEHTISRDILKRK